MSKYGVTPQKEAELLARMAACGLVEGDLDEKHIRSGGPGGQHVNRTATCVYLKHHPSGLEVKMQRARSQALNRFFARRRMCELLEAVAGGGPADAAREKARRQKSRRHRRAKKKMQGGGEP
jgi:protein subunit release factor B